jgi:glycyl-tRNA synthetase beta chain
VALAEKIDNLVGAFLVDEVPSGSKDPYGLRRAAAGLVRVLLDRDWDVPLRPLLDAAAADLRRQGADVAADDAALARLEEFIADRLAHQLAEDGVGAEAAAAAQGTGLGSIVATHRWARALQEAAGTPAFQAVWTACTRLVRIAARAGADGDAAYASAGDAGEDALAAAVAEAGGAIEDARARRDLSAALAAAAPLAAAVDRFFTDVLVNAEDEAVRARRYALVGLAARTLLRVADFPKVTDQGGQR